MNNDLKLYLLCFTRNVISLMCFTILAIVFQKWWIVFFALLFWVIVEREETEDDNSREN